MIETLIALGFAFMVAAVAIWLLQLVFALLVLPLKLAGWLAAGIGTLIGGLLCLALLPFALAAALLGTLLAILFNPVFLLAIIAVMAWMLHTQRRQPPHPRLPNATNGA